MKVLYRNIVLLAIVAAAYSCKKDNYDPPKSQLSGRLVYQGQPINLQYNSVTYQLYQYGFGQVGPIGNSFAPDGSYSQVLYDGDYKLIIPNGQGPFMWKYTSTGAPDSLSVTMKGNQTLDIEVTPYYLITSPQITAAGTDSVSATFGIQKIITDSINAKDIEFVALYVNKTQFVSGSSSENINDFEATPAAIAGSAITDMSNIQLGARYKAPATTQNYMFARIGLKIVNVEDLIFSPVIKIDL